MFQEWGFLLGEIWFLLLLAALIGLLAGWLIWGRSTSGNSSTTLAADLETSRAELAACRKAGTEKDDEIARLKEQLAAKPVAKPMAGLKLASVSAPRAAAKKRAAPAKSSGGRKKPSSL